METISISKFKATCLAVLERVRKTGEPIQVTKFGKPVAEIKPASAPGTRMLGYMMGATPSPLSIDPEEGFWDEEETVREWDELNGEAKPRDKRKSK